MSVAFTDLPPGLRVGTFRYRDGRKSRVYYAPHESDGPRLAREGTARVLLYMYAHYVFRWPEGTTRLDIGHGSIDKNITLFAAITVTGNWGPARIAEFGQGWAANELARHAR